MLRAWRHWLRSSGLFSSRHFRRREEFRSDYSILATSLLEHLAFDSAIDIGCGNGFLLSEFQKTGKRIAGLELSPAVKKFLPAELTGVVKIADFCEVRGSWDLACCVEVAEHIEPARSLELVDTLTSVARRWIYFTAAPPGQSGHGHINCRPHEEWLAWFEDNGWGIADTATAKLREDLGALRRATWLRENGFILQPLSVVLKDRRSVALPVSPGTPRRVRRNTV